MHLTIEDLAIGMYKVYQNHRVVQAKLAERGHKVGLVLVMLWLELISPEQYVRFTS